MSNEIQTVIEKFEAERRKYAAEVRRVERTINDLLKMDGRPPRYKDTDPESSMTVANIRSDAFYGRPLATATRTYLEMRKAANLGPATVSEIYDALVSGGYLFEAKNDANAKRGLRISLSKNTATFHKLPGGEYGLLAWYPDVKEKRDTKDDTDNGDSKSDGGTEETDESKRVEEAGDADEEG